MLLKGILSDSYHVSSFEKTFTNFVPEIKENMVEEDIKNLSWDKESPTYSLYSL